LRAAVRRGAAFFLPRWTAFFVRPRTRFAVRLAPANIFAVLRRARVVVCRARRAAAFVRVTAAVFRALAFEASFLIFFS
jgi:hypothetical protein